MIHNGRRAALAVSALAVGVLLSGCGGDDEADPADVAAIENLLVGHYAEPSCGDLTDAGRQAFGHPVEEAACREDIAKQQPKQVQVSDVEVDGDSATAVADDFTFDLARVDGTWLIDGGA